MFFGKLRGVYGLVRRWHARAVPSEPLVPERLDEAFAAWPFTDAAIEVSPASPGVYLLYADGQLIYIGVAINGCGIRQELESHRRGACGPRTQAASAFLFELAADPLEMHRRYLAAYRARSGGLPPCQEASGA